MSIRRWIWIPPLIVCLALSGCTGYGSKGATKDGIHYRISDSGRKAFAEACYWDLDPGHTEFVIADEVDGAEVTDIGGFTGTGVPCPFCIMAPQGADCIWTGNPEEYESDHPVSCQDLVFTIRIGKNISDINRAIPTGYVGLKQEDGAIVFYRPRMYFECDPENTYFYSKDGVLYHRKDDTPVPDLDGVQ